MSDEGPQAKLPDGQVDGAVEHDVARQEHAAFERSREDQEEDREDEEKLNRRLARLVRRMRRVSFGRCNAER